MNQFHSNNFRHFNPRTHMECDSRILSSNFDIYLISIHALTWSATTVQYARTDAYISIHALTWSATAKPFCR